MRSYGQYCSVAKALDVVGERWNLLIVRELLLRGPCRYTDLRQGLPGIATNLLGDRLRDLEQAGVVRRRPASPPVATDLFELTDSGTALAPVLRALGEWGARYMSGDAGGDVFCGHWLAFPVSLYLRAPADRDLTVEVRVGGTPMTIEAVGGELQVSPGHAADPALVLQGEAQLVLGVIAGQLDLDEARRAGLEVQGDAQVLALLRAAPMEGAAL